jgi:predicted transglutaminase-like cysteine proteinase
VPAEVTTAAEAMARADAAHVKIESHEDLCAERYAHIHTSVAGVKQTVDTVLKVLAWGGSTVFGLLILVLGFLGARAINGNDQRVDQLQNQLEHVRHTPATGYSRVLAPMPAGGDELSALAAVNLFVNAAITYEDDATHYGKEDLWVQYPKDNKGDCEDYAITKLGYLEELGWDVIDDAKIVFVTVGGYGHAILAIRLSNGQVVYLDNGYDEPMTRGQLVKAGYHFSDWKA